MTCVAGYCRNGSVWIGGDSIATDSSDGSRIHSSTSKVWKWGDFLFGSSGSYRAIQIVQQFLDDKNLVDKFREAEGQCEDFLVRQLVPTIKGLFEEHEFNTKKHEQSEQENEFLIGLSGKLFYLQQDYSILGVDGGYYAIGSGGQIALGALAVLSSDKRVSPKKIILRALEAAAYHSAYVYGPYHVLSLHSEDEEDD